MYLSGISVSLPLSSSLSNISKHFKFRKIETPFQLGLNLCQQIQTSPPDSGENTNFVPFVDRKT